MAIPIIIIPAILSKTIDDFQKDLDKLLNSKKLNTGWVHVDFMDNILVPNKSITVDDLKEVNFGKLKKEAHLMVKNPEKWITKLQTLNFQRIIIHREAKGNIKDYINLIKQNGIQAGLAINPSTAVEALAPYAGLVDVILVMGVNPGFQGQSFILQTLDKIKEIKTKGWPVKIEVDGAVKDTNAKEIVESGADILASGSYLLNGDPDQNLARLLDNLSQQKKQL
ncbi:ribulose-phosphate 3-epimerase [Patescibacteria group bacterium]|nr:ribulose-phosphate 3-epimerase [Patescibacteria group bacterium]